VEPLNYSRNAATLAALTSVEGRFAFVSESSNVRWLTGFTGSTSRAVVDLATAQVHLFVDPRYVERAAEQAMRVLAPVEVHVVTRGQSMASSVASVIVGAEMLVDPNSLVVSEWDQLSAECSVVKKTIPFAEARRVKSVAEISRIELASQIADAALLRVVDSGLVGISEVQIARQLDTAVRELGADDISFDTIVASGPNGSRPHHEPSDRVVSEGDAVVIDMGALVEGYHSDTTRTIRVGKWNPELAAMYQLVREAQQAGLAAVRPGVTGREIDEAVRQVYRSAGVEHEYIHGTGHGVGLDIHEFPILSPACEVPLVEGEVVTVEPGLYRGGVGGIRVEDLVVVTGHGCRPLTHTSKDLSCPPSPPTI